MSSIIAFCCNKPNLKFANLEFIEMSHQMQFFTRSPPLCIFLSSLWQSNKLLA